MIRLSTFLIVLITICFVSGGCSQSNTSDWEYVEYKTRPSEMDEIRNIYTTIIQIYKDGAVIIFAEPYFNEFPDEICRTEFQVSDSDIKILQNSIAKNKFFDLEEDISEHMTTDGNYYSISVVQASRTYTVSGWNPNNNRFSEIANTIENLISKERYEFDQNVRKELQSLAKTLESESPPLPIEVTIEEPIIENEREGEEILLEQASTDKAKLLSDTYSKYVGVTFQELKRDFPDIKYIGYKQEYWDYACAAYAVSENDKACFIYEGHQSMYYGIPEQYKSELSKIKDLHVWGLYGEISTLFPVVDRDLSISVFGELLGVEIEGNSQPYFDTPGLYVFEYEGYFCWFNTEEGSIIISPETNIELSYNSFSPKFIANEKRLTDALWLEVDPEGAASYGLE
jgi:hypothetical protein